MAITQVGATVSNGVNSGSDITLALPTMAEGDVVVLIGGTSNAHVTIPPTTAGPSTAGYTEIVLGNSRVNIADDWCMLGAWYKVMGPTPDASVVGQGNASTANATVYHAIVLRGVDTASVVDAVSAVSAPGDSNPPDAPAIAVATADAWVFAVGAIPNLDATATAPTGYTGLAWAAGNDTNDISCGFAYKVATSTGSENPGAFSGLDAPIELNPGAFTFAIKPAGGAAPTPGTGSGSGVLTFAGTGAGSRPSSGTGAGVLTFTGSGAGARTSSGSGSGSVAFVGTGTGTAPTLDGASGSGSGALAFVGSGSGARTSSGNGAGTLAFAGSGFGTTTRTGSGVGLLTWAGSGTGQQPSPTRDVTVLSVAARMRDVTFTTRDRPFSAETRQRQVTFEERP